MKNQAVSFEPYGNRFAILLGSSPFFLRSAHKKNVAKVPPDENILCYFAITFHGNYFSFNCFAIHAFILRKDP